MNQGDECSRRLDSRFAGASERIRRNGAEIGREALIGWRSLIGRRVERKLERR
jgi:hypothetical protein